MRAQFLERYGQSEHPIFSFFAPGRVNLIGDHTDYCGGLVFPCAIDKGTTLMIRQTDDQAIKLASSNFDLAVSLTAEEAENKVDEQWINYPLGVFQQFKQLGYPVHGIECLYFGNVPSGAGLSSSAALEVVTAFAINQLFGYQLSQLDLVKLAQRAENEFVGVQCGIMDQFAVAMAEADHAMMLDCQALECEQVPLHLGDYQIILANSNQQRELSDSKYNERVSETARALSLLRMVLPGIQELADVTPAELIKNQEILGENSIEFQRARHVVTENSRVIRGVAALRDENLPQFGALMYHSHDSLRDDYAVSSKPLDILVDLAADHEGVLGARLTGAGFGGCTVNIVHQDQAEQFVNNVGEAYRQRTGLQADFYRTLPSAGVREIDL